MPHADWLITGPEKVILPAQEIHLARSRNSSCPLVKTLYKLTTKNIPRVSFTNMEKQMTQMLRFKVKKTPNKTTVRKVLQALFLQHFNGFRNRQYIRLKVAATKVFFCFFLQSQNKRRSNKAI